MEEQLGHFRPQAWKKVQKHLLCVYFETNGKDQVKWILDQKVKERFSLINQRNVKEKAKPNTFG